MTEPNDDLAQEVMREFDSAKTLRYNWEPIWSEIGRRILPHQNVFQRSPIGVSQAERRTEFIFDSTAVQAVENCAAVFESMLFPRTQRWHKLKPPQALIGNRTVEKYLDDVTDVIFAARYSPKANFASQAHEDALGITAFGTGSLFCDEKIGEHIRYKSIPLQDLYFAENHVGVIDRVFRVFTFNAVQAEEQWGADALPDPVRAALNQPASRFRDFEWLHAVRPRKSPAYGRSDATGMAFESIYLCTQPRKIVEQGGYRVMPYATSRWMVGPREVYGRSPAFTNLADIKMLNEMSRSDINSTQLAVEPPVLLHDSDTGPFKMRPGALNYGMVNDEGKPLAVPFVTGARLDISEEKMDQRRKSIRSGFMGSIFDILMEHPDMTATQALLLAQERGILITPVMGRQQSEFLGVLVNRELDILAHAGQLPPMPIELQQMRGFVEVEYTSPLNLLQRAQDGVAILNTFQQLAPYAEAGHPEVYDIFKAEEVAMELSEINGVPAKLLRTVEEMQAMQAQKQQQANAQTLIQAAPQAAAAAKDLASAHATMQNSPLPQPVGQNP